MTLFKSTCPKCKRVYCKIKERGQPVTACSYCFIPLEAIQAFEGMNRHARRTFARNKRRRILDTDKLPDNT